MNFQENFEKCISFSRTYIVVFKVLYYIQNFLQPFFSFRMTDVGSKELSNFSVFLFSDL